jgi:hypothetical protein
MRIFENFTSRKFGMTSRDRVSDLVGALTGNSHNQRARRAPK